MRSHDEDDWREQPWVLKNSFGRYSRSFTSRQGAL
jgi:hypothetical protein